MSGAFTTLYSFQQSNGSIPNALYEGANGVFYGTTQENSPTGGTAFRLTIAQLPDLRFDLTNTGHNNLLFEYTANGALAAWNMNTTPRSHTSPPLQRRSQLAGRRHRRSQQRRQPRHPLEQPLHRSHRLLAHERNHPQTGGLLTSGAAGWQIVAAADLNGDGSPDIIWENSQTGAVAYWLMDQTS